MNSRALNTQGWKDHATYFNIHLAAFLLFSIRKHFLPLVPIITALTFLSLAECRFARFWVGHSQQQNTRNRRGWLFAAWCFPAEKRTWSSDAGFRRGLSVLWLWRRRNRTDGSLVSNALCQIAINAKCFPLGRALHSHAVHSGLDINFCQVS